MRVFFKEDIFAVTPGQLCVIYNDEGLIVLSGIIKKNIDQKNGTII
jgi:tRNA U34 2-thiouridine synthase MnmA/TrmU